MDLQHVAQHVADTVRVYDTITVHDTVRVVAPSSGFDWRYALSLVLGSGVGVALMQFWWKRRAADRRAGPEAWTVRRTMRAGFEHHLPEPPKPTDLLAWARHAAAGFDAVTRAFGTLNEIAPEASGGVENAITDAYTSFGKGAGAINRVLARPEMSTKGAAIDPATEQVLRSAYRELGAAITSLRGAMSDELRTRDDGYNAP